jgi:hypothetical protein
MLKTLKRLLKKSLVVLALPISLVVVGCMFLAGCRRDRGPVCDPVHPPQAKPEPQQEQPPVCDPVHQPPPTTAQPKQPPVFDPIHQPPPTKE